ncbi:MAG: hypothetical protein V4646_16030 [Pseudomonadota bacterium]
MKREDRLKQEEMLDTIQRQAFGYFVHEVNPVNGLVLDKTASGWPCSIAAVGMALTVYPIGVKSGFMTHAEAAKRTLTTLRFLSGSEQSESPDATGYRGFYYHFIDMQSGKRAFKCELSSIDTALLMAGVLCAASFFLLGIRSKTKSAAWLPRSMNGSTGNGCWRVRRRYVMDGNLRADFFRFTGKAMTKP